MRHGAITPSFQWRLLTRQRGTQINNVNRPNFLLVFTKAKERGFSTFAEMHTLLAVNNRQYTVSQFQENDELISALVDIAPFSVKRNYFGEDIYSFVWFIGYQLIAAEFT
jgi:hypothetical protein